MTLVRNSLPSRLAALGLLLLALVALGFGFGAPLVAHYQASVARIEASLHRLEVNRRIARRDAALRQAIERLKENRALDGLLLPAGSDGGAVAILQDKVQSIITQAGARLTSTQALPVEPGEGHRRIGLRLQFAADIEALRRILHGLESGRPALVLDNLFVRGRTSRAVGVVNPLDVRIDVFAFKQEAA